MVMGCGPAAGRGHVERTRPVTLQAVLWGLLVSPFADIMGAILYCGASGLPYVSMTLGTAASCSPYEKLGV